MSSGKKNTTEDHGLFSDKLKDPDQAAAAPKKAEAPADDDGAKKAKAPAAAPVVPKDKVYVIDDSPTILAVVSGVLKKAGFNPICHRDPTAALNELKKLQPEDLKDVKAVFSDLDMPGLSGIDVLREVRNFQPTSSLPFVMITAKTDRSLIQQAALLKVSGYLLKPVASETLIDLVGSLFPERAGVVGAAKLAKTR